MLCLSRSYIGLEARLKHGIELMQYSGGSTAWASPAAFLNSIAISARYVHPSEDAVLSAISRLGGHNSGHSEKLPEQNAVGNVLLTR